MSILNADGLFSTRLDLVLIGDVPNRRAYLSKPGGQTGSIRLTVPEVLDRKTVMISAHNLKAHCTAFSLKVRKKEEGTPDWAHERQHEHQASQHTGANGCFLRPAQ
ncbi:hypothetical protein JK208_15590 [Gluconobacter sp. Dm-74]|uniref:hypothetical protein n=1 Tax=Gluconobacter sp. Dm-74 TaxID=2799803 RepID=UPI001B8CB94C|nr:hypothetical protein [Gluconobacter sp. Dm-74]MBS1092988.1 hypothetical protein [Gluconobacter sp. Dm-74]